MALSRVDRRSDKSRRGKTSHSRPSNPCGDVRRRGSCQKSYLVPDGRFNAVRYRDAGLFLDVMPDFDEIERSLRRKNVARVHLGLAFQFPQVSIQLIFRDPFAAVELVDAAPDLRVDRAPVFQKPTILFLLGLQQTEQYFLDAAGAGRLKLLLDSGLQGRIVDFDVHGSILQNGSHSLLIVAEGAKMSR